MALILVALYRSVAWRGSVDVVTKDTNRSSRQIHATGLARCDTGRGYGCGVKEAVNKAAKNQTKGRTGRALTSSCLR